MRHPAEKPILVSDLDIIYVGTFVPKACGIATFSNDLGTSVSKEMGGKRFRVVGLTDQPGAYDYPPEVTFEIRQNVIRDYARAAEYLNGSSAQIISLQHEAGFPSGSGRKPFCALYVDEFRYHYDNQGNLVERIKHSIDGTIDWNQSESYKYDDLGRLAQEVNYDKNGATLVTVAYGYDSNGWVISKELISPMRKVLFSEKTIYSERGLELEVIKEDFEEYRYLREAYSYSFHDGSPLK